MPLDFLLENQLLDEYEKHGRVLYPLSHMHIICLLSELWGCLPMLYNTVFWD